MPVTILKLTPWFRSNWPKWAAALLYGLCSNAQALPFDIPEQDLATALMHFSQQSGLNVVRDGSLSGLRSTAISGDYSQAQALRLLLSATGLEFESIPSGMRLINPQVEKEEDVYLLPATDIIGTQNPVFDKYKTPEIKYEVTREQLDRVPYSRIGDIFNGVPGVASADGSNGAALQINIRGLQGMSRVKTLVDGSMQTSNVHRGYAGDKDQTYIDPDLIGGIDIKKGPDAGPQGAGVVGGIVNMRTINAMDIITDPDKNWGIRVKGMFGNNVATGDMYLSSDVNHTYTAGTRYWDASQNRWRWRYDTVTERGTGALRYFDRKSGRGTITICRAPSKGGCNQPVDSLGRPVPPDNTKYTTIGGYLPERNTSGSVAAAFRPWDDLELIFAYAERESGNYYAGKRVRSSAIKTITYNITGKKDGVQTLYLPGKEVMNSSHRSDSWLAKGKLYFLNDHSLEVSHIKYRTQYGYNRNGQSSRYWQDHLYDAETATYSINYAWQPDNPWLNVRANLWKSRVNGDSLSQQFGADRGILKPKNSEIVTDSFGASYGIPVYSICLWVSFL